MAVPTVSPVVRTGTQEIAASPRSGTRTVGAASINPLFLDANGALGLIASVEKTTWPIVVGHPETP